MTSDIDWAALAAHLPEDEIKQRPGAATWDHKQSCEGARCRDTKDPAKHIQFSYVDARVVAQRLDDVVTPAGWDFTWSHEGEGVVHGRLIVGGSVKEDAGYPNSDRDEEPLKAAVSDALKRCAVQFGIGRHLYEDNKAGRTAPARQERPAAAPQGSQSPVQQRPRPQLVDTDLVADDDEDNPFDDPMNTGPVVRPEEDRCPWHPNREPKQGKYGLYCSGQGGNGPLNAKGYCDYKFTGAA